MFVEEKNKQKTKHHSGSTYMLNIPAVKPIFAIKTLRTTYIKKIYNKIKKSF